MRRGLPDEVQAQPVVAKEQLHQLLNLVIILPLAYNIGPPAQGRAPAQELDIVQTCREHRDQTVQWHQIMRPPRTKLCTDQHHLE